MVVVGTQMPEPQDGFGGNGEALIPEWSLPEWSLPGYRIGPVLGRGGFATVYRAHQLSLGRDVAMKVLTADLAAEGDSQRFSRERRALAALSPHPHVADVFDAGITPERHPYLVMRLYPGGSLADRLARLGRLPVAEVVDVVTKLASALDAVHAVGMLHRDVKPQNVLLTETGEPVLSDFGIAGVLESGNDCPRTSTTFFSFAHVAPEILEDRRYSVASDVYALASTTYQLLTGAPAFDPDDPRLCSLILDTRPPPLTVPGVPARVADAVHAGMAKDPTDRPATASAFAAALSSSTPVRSGDGSASGPDARPAPGRASSSRVVFAVVATVLLATGGIGLFLGDHRAVGNLRGSGPTRLPAGDGSRNWPGTPSAGIPTQLTSGPAPTCDRPDGLRRLEGVRVSGSAKPDEIKPGTGRVSYASGNLVDGDISTAWAEGALGLGVGSTIRITFPRPVNIRLGCIVNGHGKSWDVYRRNARVRDLDVVSDGGRALTSLADSGSFEQPAVFQSVLVPRGLVSHVDLVIRSVYPAQQVTGKPTRNDTCLSEVEFWY